MFGNRLEKSNADTVTVRQLKGEVLPFDLNNAFNTKRREGNAVGRVIAHAQRHAGAAAESRVSTTSKLKSPTGCNVPANLAQASATFTNAPQHKECRHAQIRTKMECAA